MQSPLAVLDYLTPFLLAVLAVLVGLAAAYLKKLPDRLHKEGELRYSHQLAGNLEELRSALSEQSELAKIRYQEGQAHRAKEYLAMLNWFNSIITNPRKNKNEKVLKEKFIELGTNLFIFGSDETIEAYLAFRGTTLEDMERDRAASLRKYSAMVLQMRKDLFHPDTACTGDDLLLCYIPDWKQHAANGNGAGAAQQTDED